MLKSTEQDFESQRNYPLAELLEKELKEKIEQSLTGMSLLTRQIFELSRYSNLTYQEISQKCGVSVDTVKYHIKSALAKLRQDLKEYELLLICCLGNFFL